VHVYFDNDAEGHAVRNALRFQELVVGTPRREVPASARARQPWRSISRSTRTAKQRKAS
jgi:uncharacterized protein YecE (DUF72 family)